MARDECCALKITTDTELSWGKSYIFNYIPEHEDRATSDDIERDVLSLEGVLHYPILQYFQDVCLKMKIQHYRSLKVVELVLLS